MDIFSLAEKYVVPPEWMRYLVWGCIVGVIVKRLWGSAWGLKERYARQDATEAAVAKMGKSVRRLSRSDKRRGVKLALLMKAQQDSEKRGEEALEQLRAIRETLDQVLMQRG